MYANTCCCSLLLWTSSSCPQYKNFTHNASYEKLFFSWLYWFIIFLYFTIIYLLVKYFLLHTDIYWELYNIFTLYFGPGIVSNLIGNFFSLLLVLPLVLFLFLSTPTTSAPHNNSTATTTHNSTSIMTFFVLYSKALIIIVWCLPSFFGLIRSQVSIFLNNLLLVK